MNLDINKKLDNVRDMLIDDMFADIHLRYDDLAEMEHDYIAHLKSLSDDEFEQYFNQFCVDKAAHINKSVAHVKLNYLREFIMDYMDSQKNTAENADKENWEKQRAEFRAKFPTDIMTVDLGDDTKYAEIINAEIAKMPRDTYNDNYRRAIVFFIKTYNTVSNAKSRMDAQTARYYTGNALKKRGYCLRSHTLTLLKQKYHFKKIHDFLPPTVDETVSAFRFAAHIMENYPDFIYDSDRRNGTPIKTVIDTNNLMPGTLILERTDEGAAKHAKIYDKQNDKQALVSFNNQGIDNLNPDEQETDMAYVINLPGLIRQSLTNIVAKMSDADANKYLEDLAEKNIRAQRYQSQLYRYAARTRKHTT